MACSKITTSEHNINGTIKIYVNADGYGSGRLEEAYNNSKSQEENHVNLVNQSMKIFGFSKILSFHKDSKTTYIFDVC